LKRPSLRESEQTSFPEKSGELKAISNKNKNETVFKLFFSYLKNPVSNFEESGLQEVDPIFFWPDPRSAFLAFGLVG